MKGKKLTINKKSKKSVKQTLGKIGDAQYEGCRLAREFTGKTF